MCDTFVALSDSTLNGDVIFAKNSDRPQGEIQDVVALPAQQYPPDTVLKCTTLSIPQVTQTHAVILSTPRWMWGAEMGANEHGVVIGNEAVWTTQPYNKTGLLGMDLLRLGLERGATAADALQVIVELLATHGQGGNCTQHFDMNYHNSFLIADKNAAWVLETAGSYWVAEKHTHGTCSISNALSITGKGDLRHPDLISDMIAQGEIEHEYDLNFAQVFTSGPFEETLSPHSRAGRVEELCRINAGQFTLETAQSILRDHEAGICMHGEFESRGSQVSMLSAQNIQDDIHSFITGPFPCREDYRGMNFI